MQLSLKMIIASNRPGRAGKPIADWFYAEAKKNRDFDTELLDLAVINLPFLDEPAHPRLRQYTKQHTKDWSAKIESADAFIIVTPEYNYSMPAVLVNAIDYLSQEWAYKPVGFVSYGGVSGGTRAVQQAKQLVTAVKMMPMSEAVAIPAFGEFMDKDRTVFTGTERHLKALEGMMGELKKWGEAGRGMRKAQTA